MSSKLGVIIMRNKKREERLKKTNKRLGKIINPRAWLGYDRLSESASFIKSQMTSIFNLNPQMDESEDFNEVVGNLGLTPKALQKKKNFFVGLTIFFIALMLLVLGYAFYQWINGHYRAILPSFVLSFLCLALAFRYHFWYFQMKVERLGCTLQEWLDYVLSGKNP